MSKITLHTWKRGYVISEITIGEYDEFRISRILDLLVPNLTRSRRDLKKRLLKLTNIMVVTLFHSYFVTILSIREQHVLLLYYNSGQNLMDRRQNLMETKAGQ